MRRCAALSSASIVPAAILPTRWSVLAWSLQTRRQIWKHFSRICGVSEPVAPRTLLRRVLRLGDDIGRCSIDVLHQLFDVLARDRVDLKVSLLSFGEEVRVLHRVHE